MNLDYFYGTQADQFSFIRIPKALVIEGDYASLSIQAKILYGLLLDRMSMASKNKWIDDNGLVYIIYQISEIRDDMHISMRKAVDIPALVADLLDGYMKGQTRINLDLHGGEDLANLLRRVTRNVVMGLWVMALLISSSIICTTDMKPKILGIPALGAIGYLGAFVIVLYVFIKHIFSRK